MNLPKRKPNRLKNYDYSQNGYYFVTVCTYKRKNFLSKIVGQGLAPAENKLTRFGRIAEEQLLNLESRFNNVKIDKYVIMPNHIHAIIVIDSSSAGASPCPTLSSVMGAFKSLTTLKCRHEGFSGTLFQTSFYDHIIRNDNDYLEIRSYIDSNPLKWKLDRLFAE